MYNGLNFNLSNSNELLPLTMRCTHIVKLHYCVRIIYKAASSCFAQPNNTRTYMKLSQSRWNFTRRCFDNTLIVGCASRDTKQNGKNKKQFAFIQNEQKREIMNRKQNQTLTHFNPYTHILGLVCEPWQARNEARNSFNDELKVPAEIIQRFFFSRGKFRLLLQALLFWSFNFCVLDHFEGLVSDFGSLTELMYLYNFWHQLSYCLMPSTILQFRLYSFHREQKDWGYCPYSQDRVFVPI